MAIGVGSLFFVPIATLTHVLTKLPLLGQIPVIGLILMGIGVAWALININSLPMVVDMTDESHIGTFTGLYYLFSTLAAIIGPIMYGWVIQLSGSNYNLVMLVSPIFLIAAFFCMIFVKRGESKKTAWTVFVEWFLLHRPKKDVILKWRWGNSSPYFKSL